MKRSVAAVAVAVSLGAGGLVAAVSSPAYAGAICDRTGVCGEAYNAYHNPIWIGPIKSITPTCTIKLPAYTSSKRYITDNDLVCVGTRMRARMINFGLGQDQLVYGPVAFKIIDTDKYNVYMERAKLSVESPKLNALNPSIKQVGTAFVDGTKVPLYEVRR